MNALTTKILSQLECLIDSSLFNREQVVAWLEHEDDQQGLSLLDVPEAYTYVLENNTIEIADFTFLADKESGCIPVQLDILSKLKRVSFKNCTFECKILPLTCVTQWFENCHFSTSWLVTCCECDHGYTEQGDALFEHCTFEGLVTLYRNVDSESLAQYSNLFWNCTAHSLMLFDITLHTRLWDNDAIQCKNKQCLGELSIISTQATWPVNLSHHSIGTIYINSSKLVGVNFSGGKTDNLTISNSEVDGSCDWRMAKVKELMLSDATFTRPVNLDDARIGSFMIIRADFERVLSCSSTAIEDDICLSSVRYTVPPDFLGLTLTESARANSDRETFRLIKHSFEAVANRIEANRFFGLEMEAYLSELKSNMPWYSPERLLATFNHAVSRHGQSYLRPLLFFLLTAAFNGFLIAHQGWQLPTDIINTSVMSYIFTSGDALNSFAKGFTLLNPLMHPGMEFISLVLAVLMSTFLWHFLVAVRRFRRG